MSAETTSQNPQDLLVMDLSVGAEDWTPTPHGQCLAEVLAENNLVEGKTVLELGAGTGNHTILLARQGAKHIVATEITQELVETTEVNVKRNVPEASMEYRVADWLATDGSFDVVVTNPPFCKSGKQNRRYYIDSLILDAHKRLNANGTLIFVQSSMADLAKTLERLNENGYEARVIGERRGPFRDYYFEDEQFMKESASVVGGFDVVEGVHYETLSVIAATLRDYTPPAGAHIPDELRA